MPSTLKRIGSVQEKAPKKAKRTGRKPSIHTLVVRELNKQAESKEITTYFNTNTNTTGTVYVLNSVAEGTDYNNRIGRKIRSLQIQCDWTIYTTNTTFIPDSGFVALVLDKQPDGTGTGFGNIFDTSANNAGQAFRNTYQYPDRFKVMWIEHFAISSAGPACQKFRKFHKVREDMQDVSFPGSTATSPNTNAWYVCFGSVNPSSGSLLTYISFNCKYQFKDM